MGSNYVANVDAVDIEQGWSCTLLWTHAYKRLCLDIVCTSEGTIMRPGLKRQKRRAGEDKDIFGGAARLGCERAKKEKHRERQGADDVG